MAHLNVKERVIEAKIVYYGAGLSGKTTNLEQVKRLSTDGKCGELMTLDTDGDRTLFFDWLPFNVGKVNGCDVKVQLYTVPGQAQYAETRRKVLAGADGVVLVLDSQSGALEKNRQIVKDLLDHLVSNKLKLDDLALVVQLNKRDLPTAMECKELLDSVGMGERPFVEAVASSGVGVFETLREMTRLVLASVKSSARDRAGTLVAGGASKLDGNTLYREIVGDTIAGASIPAPGLSAPPSAVPMTQVNGTSAPSSHRAEVSATSAPINGASGAAAKDARAAGAPPPGSPAAVVASLAAQVNEVVASQRTMSRRFDTFERAFERAVNQAVVGAMADLERRLVQRMTEVVESAVAARLGTLEGKIEAQSSSVTKVGTAVSGASTALGAMEKKLAERLDKLGASAETHAGEAMATLTSNGSATKAAITNLERRVVEALEEKLAAAVSMQARQTSSQGEHLEAIEKNVDAMSAALKAMMDEAAAAQQKKSWWR